MRASVTTLGAKAIRLVDVSLRKWEWCLVGIVGGRRRLPSHPKEQWRRKHFGTPQRWPLKVRQFFAPGKVLSIKGKHNVFVFRSVLGAVNHRLWAEADKKNPTVHLTTKHCFGHKVISVQCIECHSDHLRLNPSMLALLVVNAQSLSILSVCTANPSANRGSFEFLQDLHSEAALVRAKISGWIGISHLFSVARHHITSMLTISASSPWRSGSLRGAMVRSTRAGSALGWTLTVCGSRRGPRRKDFCGVARHRLRARDTAGTPHIHGFGEQTHELFPSLSPVRAVLAWTRPCGGGTQARAHNLLLLGVMVRKCQRMCSPLIRPCTGTAWQPRIDKRRGSKSWEREKTSATVPFGRWTRSSARAGADWTQRRRRCRVSCACPWG